MHKSNFVWATDDGSFAATLAAEFQGTNGVRLLQETAYNRPRLKDAARLLHRFNWASGHPSDLDRAAEAVTYLTPEGYISLLPRVFNFCIRWQTAADNDFISTFALLPASSPNFREAIGSYPMQKLALEASLRIDRVTQMGFFEDERWTDWINFQMGEAP